MVVQIKSPTMACFSSIGFHALACPVGLGQLTSEADRKGVASAIETAIGARLKQEPQKALLPPFGAPVQSSRSFHFAARVSIGRHPCSLKLPPSQTRVSL